MDQKKATINGEEFTIIREHTSNKNASAQVDGSIIRIRIPVSIPREEGFRVFVELQKRILRKLWKNPYPHKKARKLIFNDGQEITVLGKRFILVKERANGEVTSSAHLCNEHIRVKICKSLSSEDEEEIFSNLVRRVIASAIRPQVEERVRQLNELHVKENVSKVFIKDNLTNWGSCSSKTNLNLSFRLLFAPAEVMDYVIIHELMHIKERNHSPVFWSLVEKAMPEYKKQRQWLKANGHNLGPIAEPADVVSLEVIK